MIDANESALNAHMNKEAAQDKRAEAVELLALDMMREGGEFYPFTPKNFSEAIENCLPGSILAIASQLSSAETHPDNHVAQECVTFTIRNVCRNYCKKCALQRADADYDDNDREYD
jgi:hypothetical protein